MHKFYFNECLPPLPNGVNLQEVFESTINVFTKLLKDESLQIEKSVITHTSPKDILICGKQLEQLIGSISDKDYRTNAFGYFTRYPINDLYDDSWDDELLEKEHDFLGLNAINLAIARKSEWILYTLPINACLKKDKLAFNSDEIVLETENWYGEKPSSEYIRQLLTRLNVKIESEFDDLKLLLGKCYVSPFFEKDFRVSQPDVQRLIIEKFKEAKNRNMLFPCKTDDNLIKQCKGKGNENTYELRFGALGGIRVYFSTINNEVYIGGMGKKSSSVGEEQSSDIKKASNEIKKLKLTKG